MARRRRGFIRYSYLRGLKLPGVFRTGEDNTIQQRESRWFLLMKAKSMRRAGARTTTQRAADGELRSYGLHVFDRRSGQAELGDYLRRGRGE